MRTLVWLSVIALLGGALSSCKEKQKKEGHYTVYQAGQTGGSKAMNAENDSSGMGTLKLSLRERILANITTDTVRKKRFRRERRLMGEVSIDPRKSQTISAWVGGQIRKLYIRSRGAKIQKGDKLYELYSPDLLSAEKDYAIAFRRRKKGAGMDTSFHHLVQTMKERLLRYGLSEEEIERLPKSSDLPTTTTIYSRRSGYLNKKWVEEGDVIKEGSDIFQLASNKDLWVQAQRYDTDSSFGEENLKIWVETDAFPRERFVGHRVYDNPVVEPNSRIHLWPIGVQNKKGILKPGMFVKVYLEIYSAKPALVVPKTALVYGKDQNYIWMEIPSSDSSSSVKSFMRMPVKSGRDNESEVEILKGVRQGEVIVSGGTYLLNSEYLLKGGQKDGMAGMDM